jgi:hypothetical protein
MHSVRRTRLGGPVRLSVLRPDRQARKPEARTHTDERRQRLGVAEPAHIPDVDQQLGDSDVAQARNAGYQFGVLAKSRMDIDVIVDLPL